MKLPSSLLALAAAAALAPSVAFGQVTLLPAPPAPSPLIATVVVAPPWSVTLPSPASRTVTAPAAVSNAMQFTITTSGVAPTALSKVGVMVMGSANTGAVSSFDVVYYPTGYANPGVVLGSSTGATFARGTNSVVTIALSTPLAISGDFTGAFAVRANANQAGVYFQPRLETISLSTNGVETALLNTELPLNGDVIAVK